MPKPSDAALADFAAELAPRIAGELRTDAFARALYSSDASLYQVMPLGVLIPRSVEDVVAAVSLAARHRIPVLPRGSGTSLAGQAVNAALVIDFSRHLDAVLDLDVEARRVRVQPGIVLDDLNRKLRPQGLMFGPDPASSDRATLGGIVANNATGSHSILHGMTADHLIETELVLADGSLARFGPLDADALAARRRRSDRDGAIHDAIAALVADPEHRAAIRAGTPRHWRRAGGYNLDRLGIGGPSFHHPPDPRFNLAQLVCGSEGTLAVISSVTLNLVPRPSHSALALVHFATARRALDAVPAILETQPAAVELLDPLGLRLARDVPAYARRMARVIEADPEGTEGLLIVEYQGDDPGGPADRVACLEDQLRRSGAACSAVTPALSPERQADFWALRKASLGLMMSRKGDRKPIPFIEDAAVPVEHLSDYVDQIERLCTGLGLALSYYAHASAGCLHLRPLVDLRDARERARLPEIARASMQLVRGFGGALSSEHGDGRSRSWLNEAFFGPELHALHREVKRIFDPEGLLNPGNIVDGPAMTEHLRADPRFARRPPRSFLDFSPEQGLDRALELCNGAGVCRKRAEGSMCPSFMVTRDEAHSTRGRANLLRAAISGLLPAEALTSPPMHAAMDLCVGCKACKAECPSAVDMAKLKVDFLARYHAAHGIPARSRLLSQVHRLSRAASGPAAPLVNTLLGTRVARRMGARTLGIAAERRPPAFARRSFLSWHRSRRSRGDADRLPAPAGELLLFADTFNTYSSPDVAIAATEVLEAMGHAVRVIDQGCCGRPMLSLGLVAGARAAARDLVARLGPFVDQGIPILGLEPSCILTLRDDYPSLLPGEPRAAALAAGVRTFEEHLAQRATGGDLSALFDAQPRRLLLHAHCHEKALVGTGPALRALGLPAGHRVEALDAGCCGMAGAFGYEAEHYAISMAMAELRLLPAVRGAGPDTRIVATGTSCRHQIADGAGRRAWHPAEILREALLPGGASS